MAKGDQEAINRIGPTLSTSGDPYAAQKATVATGASSDFIPIPNTGSGVTGHRWITFSFDGGDAHLAFGPENMGAATAADRKFTAGSEYDYEVPPNCKGFRFIRGATVIVNVDCYFHPSNG